MRLNLVSSLSSLSSHLSKSRKRGGDFFSTGIHPLLEKYLHPALHNVYQLNNVHSHTLHWFRCRSCKTKYFPFQAISASRVKRGGSKRDPASLGKKTYTQQMENKVFRIFFFSVHLSKSSGIRGVFPSRIHWIRSSLRHS